MGDSWNNGSHLEKWASVEKEVQILKTMGHNVGKRVANGKWLCSEKLGDAWN